MDISLLKPYGIHTATYFCWADWEDSQVKAENVYSSSVACTASACAWRKTWPLLRQEGPGRWKDDLCWSSLWKHAPPTGIEDKS